MVYIGSSDLRFDKHQVASRKREHKLAISTAGLVAASPDKNARASVVARAVRVIAVFKPASTHTQLIVLKMINKKNSSLSLIAD